MKSEETAFEIMEEKLPLPEKFPKTKRRRNSDLSLPPTLQSSLLLQPKRTPESMEAGDWRPSRESQAAVWTDIRQIILTFALVKMVLSRLKRKATWGWNSFLTGNRERDCQGIKGRKRRGSGRNEVRSQEKIERKGARRSLYPSEATQEIPFLSQCRVVGPGEQDTEQAVILEVTTGLKLVCSKHVIVIPVNKVCS